MMFESTWRRYVEKQELRNLKVLQEDPCFGAGLTQHLGLPPINDPQLQTCLNPLILAQARDLGMQTLMKVGNLAMAAPTQRYATIKQGPKEPYV